MSDPDRPLSEACDAIDRALAARPRLDAEALTQATKALCRQRDTLRERVRDGCAGDGNTELKRMNQLVTLLQAVHYPLSAIPWALLEEARRTLSATSEAPRGGVE